MALLSSSVLRIRMLQLLRTYPYVHSGLASRTILPSISNVRHGSRRAYDGREVFGDTYEEGLSRNERL